MARSIWSGSLTFGLVNVPISLYSATQDKTVHFNQLERGTSSRIRYRRVNEDTGEEVDYANIVKGHDVGGGQYVVVTREELEEIEPGRSRTIDISDFVDAADIDPIYYQKTYYLGPQSDQANRAYGLLRQAMMKADKVAIAMFFHAHEAVPGGDPDRQRRPRSGDHVLRRRGQRSSAGDRRASDRSPAQGP
jgi:DNA end-binding protein Ku